MKLTVIGAGVNGLSSGISLLEAGHDVTIVADKFALNTTSAVAAAFHFVYHAAVDPKERGLRWAHHTYEELFRLSEEAQSGVIIAPCTILFEKTEPEPGWASLVRNFRRLEPREIPQDYVDGYTFDTAIADMSVYLPYLTERFIEKGGKLLQRHVVRLEDVLSDCDGVINCSGLGARKLIGDRRLFAIRGQIVYLSRPKGMKPFVMLAEGERTGITYTVVRQNDIVVGGTAEDNNWSLVPDPAREAAMIARAVELFPELAAARVLGRRVGLRPGRDVVRLELEERPDGRFVVHNLGHGGAGVSLSWGCANEVLDHVAAIARHLTATAAD